MSDKPALQAQLGVRDTALFLRAGGDPRERASALMLAAVLANGFDALVLREGNDQFALPEQLLKETRAAFAALAE